MKDKHPIDKLFKDGLQAPETPFDPKDWEKLSQKMRQRKKRNIPVLVWMTSGVAAALVLAVILLLSDRQAYRKDLQKNAAGQAPPNLAASPDTFSSPETIPLNVSPSTQEGEEAATEILAFQKPIDRPAINEKAPDHILRLYSGNRATLRKPTATYLVLPASIRGNQIPSVARTTPRALASEEEAASRLQSERLSSNVTRKGWALSVIAAPDLSGIQPVSGDFSANVGLLATYRVNRWLSVSGGALYARKMYEADFSDYRPNRWRSNTSITPGFVEADCAVLDIPILANVTIKRFRRSDFFVSTGISSYFMLRETYDYRYPPEVGREPWKLTVRNQNRHLLGVGNLSVGYRRQLTPSLSLSVQPFVKVPLTGIGNGNIKLYSTGVAISADIDLTRRNKQNKQ